MFEKKSITDLNKSISLFGKKQKEVQAMLTQVIANVVYQSIMGRNIDPGIKLHAAMLGNGYNRTNDVITYLCKMGNFKYNNKDGLIFKATYPAEETLALEIAEKCISNPMFTIVKEQAIKQDLDIAKALKALIHKAKSTAKEGKQVIVHNDTEALLFKSIEDYVATLA